MTAADFARLPLHEQAYYGSVAGYHAAVAHEEKRAMEEAIERAKDELDERTTASLRKLHRANRAHMEDGDIAALAQNRAIAQILRERGA